MIVIKVRPPPRPAPSFSRAILVLAQDNGRMVKFVLGVVIAIATGVAGNLLTPVVRGALDKRSESRRPARIASIRKQQDLLAAVRAQPSRAAGELGLMLTRLLLWWSLVVVTALGSLITNLSTAKGLSSTRDMLGVGFPLVLVVAIMATNGTLVIFRKMANPDWADRQAEKQLRKLGAELEPVPEPVSGPRPNG
jgi:hypothetical protein